MLYRDWDGAPTVPWGYVNPNKEWPAVNSQCSGKSQSPVDLRAEPEAAGGAHSRKPHELAAQANLSSVMSYTALTGRVLKNNGHSLVVEGSFGNTTVAGGLYEAIQFHLHFPSEHTKDGEHFAGELHIVHRRQGTAGLDDLLVIGILLAEGSTNTFLDNLGFNGNLPAYGTPTSISGAVDIPGAFSTQLSGSFWHYNGSLTTPPCSETVRWFVADAAAQVSAAQVAKGRALFLHPSNSRPVQELHTRHLVKDQFVYTPKSSSQSGWGYADTEWKSYTACAGSSQSPIDLPLTQDAGGMYPRIADLMSFRAVSGDLADNGHGLILQGAFGNTTVPAGQYEAFQFHLHFPAEHSVGGVLHTGELHIVHRRTGTSGLDDLLVLGVFLELGAPSEFLAALGWPERKGVSADPSAFLAGPLSGPFWHYNGSLTTPPCTESVKWFVLERPASVSLEQVAAFKKRYPDPANNRPVQPLGQRKVLRNKFDENTDTSWGYSAPDTEWPIVNPACGGWSQSPIDIPLTELSKSPPASPKKLSDSASYVPVRGAKLENNGHGFVVAGHFGTITVEGEAYNAIQFHVHFPSEHSIDGKLAAGELHIVHRRACTENLDDLLVVGVMLEQGAASALLDAIGWGALPDNKQTKDIAGAVDVGAAIQSQLQGAFVHYSGSLTTPPCSETVKWFVLQNTMTVSQAQITAFMAKYPSGNNRPVQGLRGRQTLLSSFSAAHTDGWGYADPDAEWPAVDAQCAGKKQSPVDLPLGGDGYSEDGYLLEKSTYDARGGLTALNNGHGLKVSGDWGNVTYMGNPYDALQFHVHFPSEHSVGGVRRAGELHIVHRRRGTSGLDDLLVIGVFFDVGAPSGLLDALGMRSHGALPDEGQSVTVRAALNPAASFAEQLDGPFWHYNGSLTTPPCTESVKWFVLEKPATVSRAQVSRFKRDYPNPANSRPVQPLNGRKVVRAVGTESKDSYWGYTDTDNKWPKVNSDCGLAAQSPVDLPVGAAVDGSAFRSATSFSAVSGRSITNNGHGLVVEGSFGTTTVRNMAYDAIQFHFHFPSEHSVGGSLYAGELHIVHRRQGTSGLDDLLVIGIFLELGAASPALDNLGWSGGLPLNKETASLSAPVDIAANFSAPLGSGFWHYNGSLTTPPCTESVKWYVMKTPHSVAPAQVAKFKALYPDPANNRPVQPLYGREVVQGADPASAVSTTTSSGFSYADTGLWSSDAEACSGAAQSPIDLPPHGPHGVPDSQGEDMLGAPLSRFASYTDSLSGLELSNDGHGLKVAGDFGAIWVDGAEYRALQFHLHFPSEHTVGGVYYAGELHLVHQKVGATGLNDLLVIGAFIRVGAPSSFLDVLGWGGTLPASGAKIAIPGTVPLASALLPALSSPNWYRYKGSLTTPPCSETVRWFVAGGQPLSASMDQVAKFYALFQGSGNSRPPLPLNDRTVARGALAVDGESPDPNALDNWNYTNSDFFWPRLAARCAGRFQSPIDIPAQGAAHSRRLAPEAAGAIAASMTGFSALTQLQLKNNGHGFVVEAALGTTKLFGGEYEAFQFHVHFPSEHTVGGSGYEGELHIVHRRKGTTGLDDLLVIGILFSEGAASTFLDQLGFAGNLPAAKESAGISGSLDIKTAFTQQLQGHFWHYKGSLTTPPCTESVKWIVMETAATVSAAQVAKFRALYPSPANARPVQPVYGRPVIRDGFEDDHHGGCESASGWDYYNSDAAWVAQNAACAGSAQSPIDLPAMPASTSSLVGGPLTSVSLTPLGGRRIRNNGHGIVVEGAFGTTQLAYGQYEPIQFHLHFPAEHTVAGTGVAGELHIVHRRTGTTGLDDLAVIGIFFTVGQASTFLDGLGWGALPSAGHSLPISGQVDLAGAFSSQLAGAYWHYNGSLKCSPPPAAGCSTGTGTGPPPSPGAT
eukprot:TRINITY_DN117_c0_g1_i4.p1 TRINITY_DN117_c0_g1~~TRINITY_DN117_c0_g1_i4.p1  ORF type:complete len:1920 (+),score=590.14 TRINITY_DN117_c0_g1_i4:49-5760(+)